MSSYLLAFAVAAFQYREKIANTKEKTRFRTWSRPSLVNQTDWATYSGPKVLEFYENYYNITFPLKKQDLLALPELSFGAMENWGLVTYKERDLLFDSAIYPAASKQFVANAIAHELAHQWFGDLVTMEWWSDLWLNEGFATVMQYRGTDEIGNYTFDMRDQKVPFCIQLAMSLDQLPSSHPIFVPVATPDEINEIFDSISYEKGGSILNMLNHTIGGENFALGLTICHEKQILGWDGAIFNVSEFMNRWILQKGFPVVTVGWDRQASTITLSQTRFLLGNDTSTKYISPYDYKWFTPIWYWNATISATQMTWLRPNDKTVTLTGPAFDASLPWIAINPQVYGFYRVNYDDATWVNLQNALLKNHNQFDVRFRTQIIDDVITLARNNMVPYSTALNTLKFVKNDGNYLVWYSAINSLSTIRNLLSRTADFELYQEFLLGLITPMYKQLSWNDTFVPPDDVLNHKFRSLILGVTCGLGYGDCQNTSHSLFSSYMTSCAANQTSSGSCNRISPNLRSLVYCVGIERGGAKEWDFLWTKYQKETVSTERLALLNGLSCPNQPWLITKLLDEIVTGGVGRSEARYVYGDLSSNQVAMAVMWNYVTQNWDHLKQILVTAATSSFATTSDLQQVKNFVGSHNDLGTSRNAFEQSISRIETNIDWISNYASTVVAWLKKQKV